MASACGKCQFVEFVIDTHTMKLYSWMKINELSSHEQTGRKLKCILLSEKNQSESIYCVIPTTRHSEKGKTMKTVKKKKKNQLLDIWDWGRGVNEWSLGYLGQ